MAFGARQPYQTLELAGCSPAWTAQQKGGEPFNRKPSGRTNEAAHRGEGCDVLSRWAAFQSVHQGVRGRTLAGVSSVARDREQSSVDGAS